MELSGVCPSHRTLFGFVVFFPVGTVTWHILQTHLSKGYNDIIEIIIEKYLCASVALKSCVQSLLLCEGASLLTVTTSISLNAAG